MSVVQAGEMYENTNKNLQDLLMGAIVGPGRLHVPPVVADEAKLAIGFTYFFFLCLLLFTHFEATPVTENLFPPIFWHN